MKTESFTARDLNRNPARVFDAVRKYGRANILTRDSETFVITIEHDESTVSNPATPDFDAHWANIRKLGGTPVPESDRERVNRIIADDDEEP